MSRKFKRTQRGLYRMIPGLALFAKCLELIYAKDSMLKKWGFPQTVKSGLSCRLDGSAIPWMNYNVVDFLDGRLSKDMHVFEYGSGQSTLYFSERVATVTSLERNKEWYDRAVQVAPANVTMLFSDHKIDSEYAAVIQAQQKSYNLVLVDAKGRVEAVDAAVKCLTADGVILLDDSHFSGLEEIYPRMRALGFRDLDFMGLKSGKATEYRTTVFYRDGNCLGI